MHVEISISNAQNEKLKIFIFGFFRFASPKISVHGEFHDRPIEFCRNRENMHLGIRPTKSDLKSKIENMHWFLRSALLRLIGMTKRILSENRSFRTGQLSDFERELLRMSISHQKQSFKKFIENYENFNTATVSLSFQIVKSTLPKNLRNPKV